VRLAGAEGPKWFVPPYMIRKAGGYGLSLLTSSGRSQRRFYLVRFAASLGEIKGQLRARLDKLAPAPS